MIWKWILYLKKKIYNISFLSLMEIRIQVSFLIINNIHEEIIIYNLDQTRNFSCVFIIKMKKKKFMIFFTQPNYRDKNWRRNVYSSTYESFFNTFLIYDKLTLSVIFYANQFFFHQTLLTFFLKSRDLSVLLH